MILARICNVETAIVTTGSSEIAGYEGKDGWFPIDSFNFGLKTLPEASPAGTPKAAPGASGKPATGSAPPGTAKGEKKGDYAPVTISKPVDMSSCALMVRAMMERGHKTGIEKTEVQLAVDIHIVSSVSLTTGTRSLYTSLMIHLEAVKILGWDIQASADGRPAEKLELQYSRAAMVYVFTKDGKIFQKVGPYGWDQDESKNYSESKNFHWTKYEKYLP